MRARVPWRAMLRPTARAVPWAPMLACLVVGLLLMTVPAAATARLSLDNIVDLVRVVMLTGALGAAFVLDDPSAPTTAVLPVPRLARHAVRGLLAVPVLAAWWGLTLTAAHLAAAADVRSAIPALSLTTEAAALVCVAFALASIRWRESAGTIGGIVAAPLALSLALSVHLLPGGWSLFVSPGDPRWQEAHVIWGVLGVLALLACAAPARTAALRHTAGTSAARHHTAGLHR